MDVPEGYHAVAPGRLANTQTFLEMNEKAETRPSREDPAWKLDRISDIDLTRYRTIFRRVGEEYLWNERLVMPDAELAAVLHDPRNEVHVLTINSIDEGILELDFRNRGECELKYFGVTVELVNTGVGRWLMNRAIEMAWSRPIDRFWVHTGTLDHPNALAFYIRSGFKPYKRAVEVYEDPRLAGLVRRDAAPHVPLL